jgi:drug/metabolite transporter (DMT)-like permease
VGIRTPSDRHGLHRDGHVGRLDLRSRTSSLGPPSRITFTRPVIGALLPLIARRPTDLVDANVLVGMIKNAGSGFGPLLAALLMYVSGPATVFAVSAVMVGAGAALTMRLRVTSSIVIAATADRCGPRSPAD